MAWCLALFVFSLFDHWILYLNWQYIFAFMLDLLYYTHVFGRIIILYIKYQYKTKEWIHFVEELTFMRGVWVMSTHIYWICTPHNYRVRLSFEVWRCDDNTHSIWQCECSYHLGNVHYNHHKCAFHPNHAVPTGKISNKNRRIRILDSGYNIDMTNHTQTGEQTRLVILAMYHWSTHTTPRRDIKYNPRITPSCWN